MLGLLGPECEYTSSDASSPGRADRCCEYDLVKNFTRLGDDRTVLCDDFVELLARFGDLRLGLTDFVFADTVSKQSAC